MKANKAPEKIYVDNLNHDFFYRTKDANSIEYTRTDAFIEKARVWLEKHTLSEFDLDFGHSFQMKKFIEDFKNHMKGE